MDWLPLGWTVNLIASVVGTISQISIGHAPHRPARDQAFLVMKAERKIAPVVPFRVSRDAARGP